MNEPASTDEQATAPAGRRIPLSGVWRAMPRVVRRTIVAAVGATLVLLGLALIVLPGPFTIPLLLAGFFVLGTEFAWAAAALAKTRRGLEWATDKTKDVVRAATGRPAALDTVWYVSFLGETGAEDGVLELAAAEVRFRPLGDHADEPDEGAVIVAVVDLTGSHLRGPGENGPADIVVHTNTVALAFTTTDATGLAAELSRRYRIPRR